MSRASLDKDPQDVAAMFDAVAHRYDRTNDVISLGQDRSWRRATLRAVDAKPGETVTTGQPLFTMHTSDAARFDRALEALEGSYAIGDAGTPIENGGPLIAGRVD